MRAVEPEQQPAAHVDDGHAVGRNPHLGGLVGQLARGICVALDVLVGERNLRAR